MTITAEGKVRPSRPSKLPVAGSTTYAIAVLLALAVMIRIVWIAVSAYRPELIRGDDPLYKALAGSLFEGKGYQQGGHATAWWVPGWLFFISLVYRLFGRSDIGLQLVNVLLGALTIIATYAIGRKVFDRSVALPGAGAVSIWPSGILLPKTFLSENLAIPLFLLVTLCALWRSRFNDWLRIERARAGNAWFATT